MPDYPRPPYPAQRQPMPGSTAKMELRPDHGDASYKGSGKLEGKKAVITGGDGGMGRAVAIAYAREGADMIAYLDEHDDDWVASTSWSTTRLMRPPSRTSAT